MMENWFEIRMENGHHIMANLNNIDFVEIKHMTKYEKERKGSTNDAVLTLKGCSGQTYTIECNEQTATTVGGAIVGAKFVY